MGFLFIRFLPRALVHLVTDPCLPLRLSGSFAFPLGRLQAEQQLFAQRARVWPTTGRSSENYSLLCQLFFFSDVTSGRKSPAVV